MNKVYVHRKVLETKSIKSNQVVGIDPTRIMNHMSKFILCTGLNEFILSYIDNTLRLGTNNSTLSVIRGSVLNTR